MMRWLPLLVFLALGAAFALRLSTPAPAPQHRLIGQSFPAFDLPRLGESFPPAAGEGPYLVNVFASWCVPCAAEHEYLTALAANGVPLYAIDYKDKDDARAAYLARHGDPYRAILVDAEGKASVALGLTGVPETFLVSAAGTVLAHVGGAMTPEIWAADFAPYFAPDMLRKDAE